MVVVVVVKRERDVTRAQKSIKKLFILPLRMDGVDNENYLPIDPERATKTFHRVIHTSRTNIFAMRHFVPRRCVSRKPVKLLRPKTLSGDITDTQRHRDRDFM